ncbi:MAG: SDR family oxidoreductase [Acidothermus sp.]|nr:SDR family oxidoreductase [Acidothermus sp.]
MTSTTSGRVTVVTGASAGVGRAVVRELGRRGHAVGLIARGAAGLQAAAEEVVRLGGRASWAAVDVTDLHALRHAAGRISSELGPLTGWINTAFVGGLRYFWDTDDATFRRITDVTYHGYVNGTRVALEHMRPRNHGVIIQVGSAMAFRGIPLQAAYCGAKHAIKGFTESVITELRHERSAVRICMAQLPAVNTPQFNWNDTEFDEHPMPVPPIFQPEPVARAICYLLEHPRRSLWIGPSTAYTILGNRLVPRLLDWYLGRSGVDSQLTEESGPRWGTNIDKPRDERADRGAHGMFDDRAHAHDPWSWTSMHRRELGIAAGVAGATAMIIGRVRRGFVRPRPRQNGG